MATETEPTGIGGISEAAAAFREHVKEWNATADGRTATRSAMRSTLAASVKLLDLAEREAGDAGVCGASSGIVAYLVEVLPLLIDQVENLEVRIAALEGGER